MSPLVLISGSLSMLSNLKSWHGVFFLLEHIEKYVFKIPIKAVCCIFIVIVYVSKIGKGE